MNKNDEAAALFRSALGDALSADDPASAENAMMDAISNEIDWSIDWNGEVANMCLVHITAEPTGSLNMDSAVRVRARVYFGLTRGLDPIWDESEVGPTWEDAITKLHDRWHEFYDVAFSELTSFAHAEGLAHKPMFLANPPKTVTNV